MGKKSLAKNFLYNMTYQVLTLILPLITTPYLSRVLGAEGIGIYSYTYAIVTYFILFGSLGVALYGQREIAYCQEDASKRKKIFIEIILFRFITIAVASVIYFIIFMNGKNYRVYYQILFLELIAAAFDISWFFQGMEEFKKTVTRNILVRLCSVGLVFLIVKKPTDLVKFTIIYSVADLLGNLSLWLYLPKYLKGIKIKNIDVKKHLPFILMLFVPQISNQIYKILDTTMIGKLVEDKTETGFYEQGQKVIRLLLTIVTSLGVVMIPRMASTFASGDKKKINELMKLSFRFVFFLAFPLMFGVISVSKEFVPIFFGSGYEKVSLLINIICPILLLMGVANVVGTQYLIPTQRQKEYTISITIGVVVNFILNYILITLYQSIGASIATVLSQLAIDIIQFYYIRNDINIKELLIISWKYLLSSLIMFAGCFGIRFVINTSLISNLLIKIASILGIGSAYFINLSTVFIITIIGMIIYFVMLIILKDEYVFEILNTIKRKLFKKAKEAKEV